MKPARLLAAFVAALAACPAAAAAATTLPSLIEALRARGAEVRPLGLQGGLQGWFVTPASGDGPYSLYVAPGGHAVAGLLYEPGGDLVTERQIAALQASRPAPRTPSGEATRTVAAAAAAAPPRLRLEDPAQLFREADGALGFDLGSGSPRVVVFADPTCPHSRTAVARIGREAISGHLRLTVVPVGVLGRAGVEAAAGVLGASDMAGAWLGSAPPAKAAPEAVQRVDWNNALFARWPETAVPLIAWRTAQGTLGHTVGDITDLAAWLRQLHDLPKGP